MKRIMTLLYYFIVVISIIITITLVQIFNPFYQLLYYYGINCGIPDWVFFLFTGIGCICLYIFSIFFLINSYNFLKEGMFNHRLYIYFYIKIILQTDIKWSNVEKFKKFQLISREILKSSRNYLKTINRKKRYNSLLDYCNQYVKNEEEHFNKNHTRSEYEHIKTDRDSLIFKNYCNVLDIIPPFDLSTLKKAYYKKIKIHHPDLHMNSDIETKLMHNQIMQKINEAYDYLEKKV
jgi:hypothetical protein